MTYVKDHSQANDGTKMECGCHGVTVNNHTVTYLCPLHGAAPALLALCEEAYEVLSVVASDTYPALIRKLGAAIAQAKGEAGND